MKANGILLLGLKHRVTAIAKSDGHHIWSTEIRSGGFGGGADFITLACDDSHVFAYSGGHLHCLDLMSGRLLWIDELRGYGFGLASLCVPGFGSMLDDATLKNLIAQQDAAASAGVAASTAAI